MPRKHLLAAVLLMTASMLLVASPYAGTEVVDVLTLSEAAYGKHKEAPVVFSHKKHYSDFYNDYPELYESPCGECHHDKDANKLADLKEGDAVQKCIECHKKPEYIKGKAAKGLSKKQKREYHANALHDNCKGCHKQYNKPRKLKPGKPGYAPRTCQTCHIKEK